MRSTEYKVNLFSASLLYGNRPVHQLEGDDVNEAFCNAFYIDVNDKIFWGSVIELFSNFQLNNEIRCESNWTSLLDHLEKPLDVDNLEKVNALLKEPIDVYFRLTHDLDNDRRLKDIFLNFLTHLFLVIELSNPGIVGLPKIEGDGFKFYRSPLPSAFDRTHYSHWIKPINISIKTTWDWFSSLNIGKKQVAKSGATKALFALMHYTQSGYPHNILWLATALEALYDTPSSSVFSTLIRRIFLVLGTPKSYKKKIKQDFREFYRVRSKVIHGDFDIHNPLSLELIDLDSYDVYTESLSCDQIALEILLCSMQKMVVNNWKRLGFMESFCGS